MANLIDSASIHVADEYTMVIIQVKDEFYSGPELDTLGGVNAAAVGASNHFASVVCPEIAHLRK